MNNKRKVIVSVMGVVISIILLVISTILAEEEIVSTALETMLITVSVCMVIIAVFFATRIDYDISVYECRKCGHIFKPDFKTYFWGAHSLTTRYLKCPKCEEKNWCKRKKCN